MTASGGGQASLIGTTLGQYEVQALIGRGAMATVYLARDTKLNRKVALKVLLGSLARNEDNVKQFHLEAQAAAPLRHPNIVRVYSAGVERGTPYIAMEYVEGETLDRFLRRKGRVQWVNALFIGEQVAQALAVAHKNGIVHRDIKPANIILDRSGRVRLSDFGIANVSTGDARKPGDAGLLGTPQYMAPEQFTKNESSPKSDLYSLGVVLYQLMSGDLPFEGESSMALIKSITHDNPPRLNKIVPEIPDDVARLVAYLMEKEPRRRPANARVLTGLIQRIQEQKGGTSALPEALTSFIKEQAKPTEVRGVTPSPSRRPTSGFQKRGASETSTSLPIRRYAFAIGVAMLSILAFSLSPYLTLRARSATPDEAPRLNSASFRDVSPGVIELNLLSDELLCTDIAWMNDRDVLVARYEGKTGSLFQGAVALAAVDMRSREVLALRPPLAPAMDAMYSETAAPVQWGLHAMPNAPAGAPLRDAILVSAYENFTRRSSDRMVILAHHWDRARPAPEVLYRYEIGQEPRVFWDVERDRQLPYIAVHPDGRTVCLVGYDAIQQAFVLSERDVTAKPSDGISRKLTTAVTGVIPSSVQYSPTGTELIYARKRRGGVNEVWRHGLKPGELNGQLAIAEAVGSKGAFSTDGAYLAWQASDDTIAIVELPSGAVAAEIGGRGISDEAWHPLGRHLIVADWDAETESDQLFAVSVNDLSQRRRLTQVRGGVDANRYAVSRGGTWAAAVSNANGRPRIYFIDVGGL